MLNTQKQVKLAFCWGYLFLLIGQIITGLVFIGFWFDENRESMLSEYHKSVEKWEISNIEFQSLKAKVYNEFGRSDNLNLEQYFPPDHDIEGNLPEFVSYYYTRQFNSTTLGLSGQKNYDFQATVQANLLIEYNNTISDLTLPELFLFKNTSHTGIPHQNCQVYHGGIYQQHHCIKFWKLVGFCVKIVQKGSNWELDGSNQSIGCEGTELNYGLYERINHGNPTIAIFESFTATIHSGDDPVIKANIDTEGTFEFGTQSAWYGYTGIGLVIIGLMLIIQPIFQIKRKCDFSYRPGQYWREANQSEQFDEDNKV